MKTNLFTAFLILASFHFAQAETTSYLQGRSMLEAVGTANFYAHQMQNPSSLANENSLNFTVSSYEKRQNESVIRLIEMTEGKRFDSEQTLLIHNLISYDVQPAMHTNGVHVSLCDLLMLRASSEIQSGEKNIIDLYAHFLGEAESYGDTLALGTINQVRGTYIQKLKVLRHQEQVATVYLKCDLQDDTRELNKVLRQHGLLGQMKFEGIAKEEATPVKIPENENHY